MYPFNEIAAFDSFMVHTCKIKLRKEGESAVRTLSGWYKTTMGYIKGGAIYPLILFYFNHGMSYNKRNCK